MNGTGSTEDGKLLDFDTMGGSFDCSSEAIGSPIHSRPSRPVEFVEAPQSSKILLAFVNLGLRKKKEKKKIKKMITLGI